jgi:hypothetical protein
LAAEAGMGEQQGRCLRHHGDVTRDWR